jgi:uncharacterized protein YjbI with pentapeptide repeats
MSALIKSALIKSALTMSARILTLRRLTRLAGLVVGLALSAGSAAGAQTIVNNDEERPDPWVINGCTIGPKAQCAGADLRHADLKNANLNGADLKGANLARADLRHADLRGARLDGANLGGALLQIAFMQGLKARNASFIGANLDHARMAGADVSGSDFTVANLEMVQAKRAQFVGAKLINTDMQEAKFYEVNLTGATMDGAKIRFAIFQDAWMPDCKGCPIHWQTDKPVWETYPTAAVPRANLPDDEPPSGLSKENQGGASSSRFRSVWPSSRPRARAMRWWTTASGRPSQSAGCWRRNTRGSVATTSSRRCWRRRASRGASPPRPTCSRSRSRRSSATRAMARSS